MGTEPRLGQQAAPDEGGLGRHDELVTTLTRWTQG